VLLFVAHRALVPMAETDLFFHLELGDLIRAHRSIPFRNLFSFTWPDQPDPDLAWGFQVLVSLLYQLGGFAAIVVAKAALIVVAAALAHAAARRAGAGPVAAALATVTAVCAADPRLCERPHLMTFVGLGATWNVLLAAESRPRLRFWLVPLTWVWANFHAGVFFSPLVVGLYAVASPMRRRLLPILPLLVVAMFLTPAGLRLPHYLLWHTGLGATRIIDEFRHADLWNDPWFFALLTLAVLTFALLRRRRLELALPLVVVAALAWRSVRFVAEWALLATPYLALGLERVAEIAALKPRTLSRVSLAVALVALIALERSEQIDTYLYVDARTAEAGAPRVHTEHARLPLGLAEDVVPFAAIDYVTRNGLRDRLYEDLDVGCYLLWEGWPRYRVFQDARLPAYPDAFHRALDGTPLAPAAFDALLTRYGVDAALLSDPDINMRAGSFDPETWALVYRWHDALVFARRTPAHAALIARDEIPLRVTFAFVGGSHVEPLPRPPRQSPVPPCEWDRRLGAVLDQEGRPDRALDARVDALDRGCLSPQEEADVRFRLGARLLLAGRASDAAVEYDRVLAIEPKHVAALVNRGFARLVRDHDAARADFERALALDSRRADARLGLQRLQTLEGRPRLRSDDAHGTVSP
jgi:tetratricopeptide (TPR) repeat protein